MANTNYESVYAASLADREAFWGKAAEDIVWAQRWTRVLDDSKPPFYRWFAGAKLNTCYNALDYHVESGRGEQVALIYDSAVTDALSTMTYRELLDQVASFAGALRAQGVEPGDRVIVYMPMIPEAVVSMLACARIGAVHSVVFGGFAENRLDKSDKSDKSDFTEAAR